MFQGLHDPCITTADCEWSDDITGKTECKYSGHLTSTCQCREGFVEYNNMCYYSGMCCDEINFRTC